MNEKYRVEIHKKAQKELGRIPKEIADTVLLKAFSLSKNPFGKTEALRGTNLRKMRVGKYRIFINILYDRQIVEVRKIKLRKVAYKDI
ncbi:MAG: type II toxin-antitoxin system RelE/ParE family toxin [Candidatus Micrarchaeota archaeon]